MQDNPLETGTPPATDTGATDAPATTPPTTDEPASGLPSDQPNPDLIGGKWESTEQMLEHIKEMEDKYADARREIADKNKTEQQTTDTQTQEADTIAKQQDVINSMIPEFKDNGMIITEDMERRAVEAGIDVRDLKLDAMEFKERLLTAYIVTGGRENYDAMIEWGKTNLNEQQAKALEAAAQAGLSELAIEGLWARYSKAASQDPDAPRIMGDSVPSGLQPYKDRKELYADKDYIESAQGRNDKAAIKRYRDRLRITPNEVLGI